MMTRYANGWGVLLSRMAVATLLIGLVSCTKVTKTTGGGSAGASGGASGGSSGGNGGGGTGPDPGIVTSVQCSIPTVLAFYWRSDRTYDTTFACEHSQGQAIKSIECELDSAASVPCDSLTGHHFAVTTDGHHQFRIKATANDGAVGYSQYVFWGVDSSGPVMKTARLTKLEQNAPTFEFTAEEQGESGLAKFQCRLSKEYTQWEDCVSPHMYPVLADNQTLYFDVRAVDVAGNMSAPARVEFKTDSIPCRGSCVFTAPIAAWSRVKSQAIQYACISGAETIAGVECRSNSGDWKTCDSATRHTLTGLAEGPQEFEVRMRTDQGRFSLPIKTSWKVDTQAPNASITQANVGTLQPSFEFSASDPGGEIRSYYCQLRRSEQASSSWAVCTSPMTYSTGVEPGKDYTFSVKAVDRAGNESPIAQYEWRSNPNVGPGCTILTTIAGGITSKRDLNIAYQCSCPVALSKVECRLDNGAWSVCQTRTLQKLTSLSEGIHSFQVRGTDSYGNLGAPSTSLRWIGDYTPPQVRIIQADVDHPNARVTFAGNDGAGQSGIRNFDCSLNDSQWSRCVSPVSFSQLVLNADYTFRVRATDFAGWVSPPAIAKFKSVPKASAPSCKIGFFDRAGQPLPPIHKSPEVVVKTECVPTDTLKEIQCTENGTHWRACGTSTVLNQPTSGEHCVWVRGLDTYGRFGCVEKRCWTLDLLPPKVIITDVKSAPGSTPAGDQLRVLFKAEDVGTSGIDHSECRLVGSDGSVLDWRKCSSPWTPTGPSIGRKLGTTYDVYVKTQDRVGNWSPEAQHRWVVQPESLEYNLAVPTINSHCPWGVGDNLQPQGSTATARLESSVELPSVGGVTQLLGLDLSRIKGIEISTAANNLVYDDEFFLVANNSLLIASSGGYETKYSTGNNGFKVYDWMKTRGGPLLRGSAHYCAFASSCVVPRTEREGSFLYTINPVGGRKLLEQLIVDKKFKLRLIAVGDNDYGSDCRFLVRNTKFRGWTLEPSLNVKFRVLSQ